jgi:hypothetical protein
LFTGTAARAWPLNLDTGVRRFSVPVVDAHGEIARDPD